MSNPTNPVSSSSVLSLVPSDDDSSPAGDDTEWTLELVIQEMISSTPDLDDVTVDEVLHDEVFKDIRSLAKQALENRQREQRAAKQAKEAAIQIEQRRIKKEKAERLRATAGKMAGFDPLSPESIKKMERSLAASSDKPKQQTVQNVRHEDSSSSDVPEAVLRLRHTLSELPDFMFEDGYLAQAMRAHFVKSACAVQQARRQLDRTKNQELFDLYSARNGEISRWIGMCQQVIKAWGLRWDREHRDMDWASPKQETWVWHTLEDHFPEIYKLHQLPKLEDLEEKARREQQAISNKEKQAARLLQLKQVLKARLLESNDSNSGMSETLAETLAGRTADKVMKKEKYATSDFNDKGVVTTIFAEMAIARESFALNKAEKFAKGEGKPGEVDTMVSDHNTAMYYARAAGMDEQALAEGVDKLRNEGAKTTQVVENPPVAPPIVKKVEQPQVKPTPPQKVNKPEKKVVDRNDPNFGAEKPETVAKREKNKGGKKGDKKPSKSERKKARQQAGQQS
ncbi:MAG: hypothetical protein A2534_03415 [Candidatus Magasanikbacteria bacterium RIFOXYD2_FULL_39_9]|nr:MAG: hypothetical protein A2534_03415 [Candidatus Magasanikbacteria bacterium RIFOXYD2_FULL_39_9]